MIAIAAALASHLATTVHYSSSSYRSPRSSNLGDGGGADEDRTH
jgi:hypothetical protein